MFNLKFLLILIKEPWLLKRPYCWITEHDLDTYEYAGPMWPLEEDERFFVFCKRCNLIDED